ncbi:hypothetical protein [Carboxylicivirga sp. N1Y90]|uniref:hypothetical protein n=1 Tax=Carboxylicivirga fragile TaxID=3417571 RepID=UPI003D326C09|nr:hypothetical protein [Marinilabiliaceae bacterium N1Y90]
MINKYISKVAIVLIALVMWQCEPKVDSFTPSSGSADFSSFVAIGDSYTAGYTDGALGQRGQMESFAYILAKQLESVGSKGFNQPMVKSRGSVGSTVIDESGSLNGYYELSTASGSLAPVPTMGDMAILAERVYDASNPFHNVGIPGAKVIHMRYPGYGMANPFFTRFASNPVSTTVIDDAMLAKPTFACLWIGNNDVLGYALAGGESDAITPHTLFQSEMEEVVDKIFAEANGVIGNIPAIDAIPFFNTVTYDALVLDQATADMLNAHPNYIAYNQGSEALGLDKIIFQAGSNALVIADEDYAHPGKIRQIKKGEKVLLSASGKISDKEIGWGYMQPIPATHVLDEFELEDIRDETMEYNSAIATICDNEDIALVDLSAIMDELSTTGLIIDGNKYTDTFVTGGVFSLDGIHATGRGSAIIANAFIEAINKQYGAMVPLANINDYAGVKFP